MVLIKFDHKLTLTIQVNANVSVIYFRHIIVYGIKPQTFNLIHAEGKQIQRQGGDLFTEFS